MIDRRAFLGALGALPALAACAKPPATNPLPPIPPAPPLHLSPLADLIAAAGVDLFGSARFAELLAHPAVRRPFDRLFPPDRVAALHDLVGFDPSKADEGVLALMADTTVYAFAIAHERKAVEDAFRKRVPTEITVTVESPQVTRYTGVIGHTKRGIVDLEEQVVVIDVGGDLYARAAAELAQGKLKRSKPVLAVEPFATLAQRLGDAPFRVLIPNGGKAVWSDGAHGVLPHADAIGLAARPVDAGAAVTLIATGDFGDGDEGPKRLEATAKDLQASSIGRLMGLDRPRKPFAFSGDRTTLRAEGTVDLDILADGLRAATGATMREIFESAKK